MARTKIAELQGCDWTLSSLLGLVLGAPPVTSVWAAYNTKNYNSRLLQVRIYDGDGMRHKRGTGRAGLLMWLHTRCL
ncbi:hypothetical protein B0J13DRAFT_547051, partial [Dactylonectria estremocensis]